MNRMQKMAWWMVGWILAGVVCAGVAFFVFYFKVGMPKAMAGFSFLAIAAMGAFSPLIFRKDKGAVQCDERDILISRRAAIAGFGAAYLFVGLACMIPFSVLGPEASISVTWLPLIFTGAFLSSFFVNSLMILLQYGWKENKDE